jgi:ABC-type sugar transport system permease subunit
VDALEGCRTRHVVGPPKWVGLKNYVDLFGDELFWRSLADTAC